MSKFIIHGERELSGNLRVHGAKNSVLPILAATLMSEEVSVIQDCPNLSDVISAFNILKYLGCEVSFKDNTARINAAHVNCHRIPDKLMREMRSSVMFLGAIIARCKSAIVSYPGGCE